MNFLKRLITALLLLPLLIAVIHFGGLPLAVTVVAAGVYLSDEIARMVLGSQNALRPIFWLTSTFLLLMLVANLNEHQIVVGLWSFLFVFGIIFTGHPKTNLESSAKVGFAIAIFLYAFLGIAAFFYLRQGGEGGELVGRSFVYLTLISTFGNDTFAYVVGKWIGRHPLLPSVSEKKTWEGFFAGAAAAVGSPFLVSAIFSAFEVDLFVGLSLLDLLFVSIGIGFLAPLGDLIESRIKRACKVKDSGSLLPGHGGLFDRVDALLVTLPFVLAYAFFLRPL